MSSQLFSKFRGVIVSRGAPQPRSVESAHSPLDHLTIEQRLRGYGMSGFRPAGLPDAWSEVDLSWSES